MFLIDQIILIGAVLLLVGVVSSKISMRVGLPVLVLFLIVGMLAGEEGIGRIHFDNFEVAHAIGTLALAAILFDGGLQTPLSSIHVAWKPSFLLATFGVAITAGVTGVAAAYVLDFPLLDGLLLGSIVGSTDAAAVFAVLRSQGLRLKERVAATLEIESGSNDPMAIFLTIGLIEVLAGRMELGPEMVKLFLLQMVVGAGIGIGAGWLAVKVVNRIELQTAGLYPVLTGGFGLFAFGAAAALGGSGFLAIYLTGIVLGNSRFTFQRGTLMFHSGLAWMGQISMFVVLGLLSTPSQVLSVAVEGLLISAVLIFIARPIAVVPILIPFGFTLRELVFLSWVGLKGAVPIILATFPLLFGLPEGMLIFNAVFFVVLVSAVLQGWTLPLFARKLGLEQPGRVETSVGLEITALKEVGADIVEYVVEENSRPAGRRVSRLALPEGAVVAMISRNGGVVPPRGSSTIIEGDHVFVVLRPEIRPLVDRVFSRTPPDGVFPPTAEFPLSGTTTLDDLEASYGLKLRTHSNMTLDDFVRGKLGDEPPVGTSLPVDNFVLYVRKTADGRVLRVGFEVLKAEEIPEEDQGPPLDSEVQNLSAVSHVSRDDR